MSKASKLYESSKTKRVGTQKLDSHKTFSDKLMSKLSSENPDVADIHQLIQEFMTATDKYERILYSHITNNFYELDKLKIDTVIANVGELLAYSESFDGGDVDCKKVIIKLYDHIMLANHQRGCVNDSVDPRIVLYCIYI